MCDGVRGWVKSGIRAIPEHLDDPALLDGVSKRLDTAWERLLASLAKW
jgi:hypothetical protein